MNYSLHIVVRLSTGWIAGQAADLFQTLLSGGRMHRGQKNPAATALRDALLYASTAR
jgi:hypothetical protein